MKPRDIFGLLVRVCGFGAILFGLADIFHVIASVLALTVPSQYPAGTDMAAAAFYLLVGFGIMLGAGPITSLAYGREGVEGR